MSTRDPWQQVKSLFHAAIEKAPEERNLFLHGLEQQEPELAREVVSLLRSHDDPSTLSFSSGTEGEPGLSTEIPMQWTVGSYRMLDCLGQGGMGTVYEASPLDNPDRRVAIKLVRPGLCQESVLSRFRAEAQILARLDHPNIAALLDTGTTEEGIPYLVMELVEGVPIDRYCEENQLSVDQRLELLSTVCSAVDHAHQHRIVHRDLKPSNVLVTRDGVPKLLDFGIAKPLDPEVGEWALSATRTGWIPMTPPYASPEQLRGEPVDTTSDIYSLGALAHEVLTGRLPWGDESAPDLLLRRIYRGTTELPSRIAATYQDQGSRPESAEELRSRLAGRIDRILLRALKLEAEERFHTATQLGEAFRSQLQPKARPTWRRLFSFTQRDRETQSSAGTLDLSENHWLVASLLGFESKPQTFPV